MGYCIVIKEIASGSVLGRISDPASLKKASANRPVVFTLEDARRRADFLERRYTSRCRRMGVISRDFMYDVVASEAQMRSWHLQRKLAIALMKRWGEPA